ncbi:MAG: DUF1592 domain-containing protein [Planctomycetota bacterium]
MQFRSITTYIVVLATVTCTARLSAETPANIEFNEDAATFLESNCAGCHDGLDAEGGFQVSDLLSKTGRDLSRRQSLHQWTRAFDRVREGEMPPPEDGALEANEKTTFERATGQWIDAFVTRRNEQFGRVGPRRLTNRQLERTLCDLLAIDIPLARLIPEETRTDGFRNIADAQPMSHYHLSDHLRVVDAALDEAFRRAGGPQDESLRVFPPKRIANKPPGRRNRDPELRKGLAVIWNGTVSFYGRISNSRTDREGWYRIRLKASCLNPPPSGTVWCSVRSGECVSRAPLMNWIGSFEATPEPTEHTFTAWIDQSHLLEIRPADATMKTARFRGGQIGFGEGEGQNAPGVAFHSLSLERIYPGGTAEQVRELLFGETRVEYDERQHRFVHFGKNAKAEFTSLIERFARRAFRAPVSRETLAPFVDRFQALVDGGSDPVEALRTTYRTLLCSPRFLYFHEPPGALSDYAIASRLSYLLTGTMPDAKLFDAADRGVLREPEELSRQVRRLLDGPNFESFVKDFSDQWLDLADIAFTEPDRRLHRDFDLVVQNAMHEETNRFLRTLITENRPANELVDAKFTWLNGRLADYYDIDAKIDSSQWSLVSLDEHPYRGGLMTHGSVLKVTANGSNTSPVIRGAWVCERLLGTPVPDPPENVPAIEPDIRGAKTIREQLEKHRSLEACAACHAKIDPPGFALEQFDAAGRWRDRYLVRKSKRNFGEGPVIDASYQLADGTSFRSFTEYRQLAARNRAQIARNFVAQLLVYGTGHEITFADRKTLDTIVKRTEKHQHGLRSLIEATVDSHTFLHK